MSNPSFINLPLRLRPSPEQWNAFAWQLICDLRVACPGIIQSFDAIRQTVKVQLAIRENILQNLVPTATEIAPLVDVPVLLLGGNGFTICPPIAAGDECLVIFADMCIDAWWQSGGVQNQMDRRRHDLSDGFALVGVRSQPRKLTNYSATSLQIRSDDGNTMIEIGANEVTVKATSISLQGDVEVTGTLKADGTTTIQGKDFLTHKHTGVQSGGSNSGPVL